MKRTALTLLTVMTVMVLLSLIGSSPRLGNAPLSSVTDGVVTSQINQEASRATVSEFDQLLNSTSLLELMAPTGECATASPPNCELVRQICDTIRENMYNLCVDTSQNPSSAGVRALCRQQTDAQYNVCVVESSSNGCMPWEY